MDRKEYMKEYLKEYRQLIKEGNKEYRKVWMKTENGVKYRRICGWKQQGIIFSDYDLLYDIFINTEFCDLCKVKFSEDIKRTSTTRCLDHDHTITDCENVRNILCHKCNMGRG